MSAEFEIMLARLEADERAAREGAEMRRPRQMTSLEIELITQSVLDQSHLRDQIVRIREDLAAAALEARNVHDSLLALDEQMRQVLVSLLEDTVPEP